MPRIVFKMPPCWIKSFFFFGVFALLFANVLNTFFFFAKILFCLPLNWILEWMILVIRLYKVVFADFKRPFFVKVNMGVAISNCQTVLAYGLSCWPSHCYHKNGNWFIAWHVFIFFSKLGYRQLEWDLCHWKFWQELNIHHVSGLILSSR